MVEKLFCSSPRLRASARYILFATLYLAASMFSVAGPMDPAAFTVTDVVAVPAERIKPLGFGGFLGGGVNNMVHNNLIRWSEFEPYHCRFFALIKDIGPDGALLDDFIPGTKSGFMEGARVRIYRIVDKDGQPLPEGEPDRWGHTYLDLTNANRIERIGEGIVRQWKATQIKTHRYEVRMTLEGGPELRRHDGVFIDKRFVEPDPETLAESPHKDTERVQDEMTQWRAADNAPLRFTHEAHDDETQKRFKPLGESGLRVDCLEDTEHFIQQMVFGGNDQDWYTQLEPGRNYRLSLWMKRSGLGDGRVDFEVGSVYPGIGTSFTVGEEWACYTYDFPATEIAENRLGGVKFTWQGKGTLWFDNIRLFRWDTPADLKGNWAPNRTALNIAIANQPATGEKGLARSAAGLYENSMDAILSFECQGDRAWTRSGGLTYTLPPILSYWEMMGKSPESRMIPMLTMGLFYTEEEWQNLIEYLAAPYDPAVDTPEEKPYAYRRFTQRGHGKPWTDTFRKFIIEFGNENWHNRIIRCYAGFGRKGAVWQDGFQYGLFGKYVYENAWKKSPYWESEGLEDKIELYLTGGYTDGIDKDGNPKGYGPDAMRAGCPPARWCSKGLYVGAKGEAGIREKTEAGLNLHGWQKTLFGYQIMARDQIVQAGLARQAMAERGKPYDLIAYESGPTGMMVGSDRKKHPEMAHAAEVYAKSKACAIAALDAWLDAPHHGFIWSCYVLHQGLGYCSHVYKNGRFIPTAAFAAHTLRNHEIRGDMLKVKAPSLPAMDLERAGKNPGQKILHKDVPLVRCYAYRDGTRFMVCLLSLKADGAHDGLDFGDGVTPCTVNLPFRSAKTITLHTLTGNLRGTNLDSYDIQPMSKEIPAAVIRNGILTLNTASGSPVDGLPPGDLYLYVFEETDRK